MKKPITAPSLSLRSFPNAAFSTVPMIIMYIYNVPLVDDGPYLWTEYHNVVPPPPPPPALTPPLPLINRKRLLSTWGIVVITTRHRRVGMTALRFVPSTDLAQASLLL